MQKNILFTKEEKDILKSVKSGDFISTKSKKKDIMYYANIAKENSAKNKITSVIFSEITNITTASSFDFLIDEPEIYSINDIKNDL